MPIQDEGHAIDEVVDRLAQRFPDIPAVTVREVVEAQLAQFAGSPVRDFVPVLVEHEALELLRAGERSTSD
ncbi:three-helix bundle dimerization domain-containing protein [Cellulomonas sp. ICMP 17802]|uniref:three-helix bundle dimerization domain-containing protein n=1 Tax=Cellulomonas sp. ICMP 17802 TaxID=3239199 RepID=UPI00351BC3B4